MGIFREKYDSAIDLATKYRDAPRKGWDKPGSRAKSNQTIEVPRQEAENLANDLAYTTYASFHRLYEIMELTGLFEKLAETEPGAVRCKNCFHTFLPIWMGGNCPYCRATESAQATINKELEASRHEQSAD